LGSCQHKGRGKKREVRREVMEKGVSGWKGKDGEREEKGRKGRKGRRGGRGGRGGRGEGAKRRGEVKDSEEGKG